MDGQGYLHSFGHHSQERQHPHPEYCPRASDGKTGGDADNIPHAHRTCQCSRGGLKRSHPTLVPALSLGEYLPECVAPDKIKFSELEKSGFNRKKNSD